MAWAQLAVDTALARPVRRDGTAQLAAGMGDSVQLAEARRRKERKSRELFRERRCRLVVVALGVEGRWSVEAVTLVRLLAKAKARGAPSSCDQR